MSSIDIKRGEVVASVDERYLKDFIADGWAVCGGDHQSKIESMKDKDEVESYIKDNFGVELDKRGTLETVKEKALAVINESGRADS